jgi:GntR family transcriptional regulator/MocR family aminotransferase
MSDSWSTSSLDLLISDQSGDTRRAGLERALRQAIRDGRLGPGSRLPSERALAHDLGLARGTVSEAYAQLVAEGFLTARQGSGTVVAPHATTTPLALADEPAAERPRFDFHPGRPDMSGFPRTLWASALRRALRTMPDEAFGYGDPRGRLEVRSALAAYLGRVRGVLARSEQIVVTSGFVQALGLVCAGLRARGARAVAMEDPTMPDHRAVVRAAGLEVVPVAVDAGGVRMDLLAGRQVDAVVVTPAHQFPLGGTLEPARRSALVRWARETGALIVEDDYDGELRYDRQPVGALQGLDPDRVAYVGTASKSLAPALRLGWLALPGWLVDPVMEAKRLADRHGGVVEQLALADLLDSGSFDRHVRQRRAEYRRRRDELVGVLAERVPTLRPVGLAAGLHFALWLPPTGPSEDEVVARAAERSIGLLPLGELWHDPAGQPPGLLIGYASPLRHRFSAAVGALADLLAGVVSSGEGTFSGRRRADSARGRLP